MINKIKQNNRLFTAGMAALSLFLFGMVGSAYALTWDEFSKSVSATFSDGQGLSIIGLLGLILIVLVACLVVLVMSLTRFQKKNMQRLVTERYKRKWADSVVKLPNGETPQKRKYYRFRTDASLQWAPAKDVLYFNEGEYNVDQLWDISAGGLSFTTQEVLEIGSKVKFLFDFGEKTPLLLEGNVIRVEIRHKEDSKTPLYNVGIKFSNIREEERDIIIGWIMKRQRTNIASEAKSQDEESENISV